MRADRQQQGLAANNQTRLFLIEPADVVQIRPRLRQMRRFGQPQHQMQIAQTAGRFFTVRLQAERRFLKTCVTRTHFRDFVAPKRLQIKVRKKLL